MNELRERIRSRLDELNAADVSRESIAEAAVVTVQALSNWLNGHREPRSVDDWQRLAAALQMQPSCPAFGNSQRDARGSADESDSEEMKQAHRASIDADRRLPEPAKAPVRALIESLTVAFDPTYHAFIEKTIARNAVRDGKHTKERT
jgi:transcriptional regulator with XRE-family HTH domain